MTKREAIQFVVVRSLGNFLLLISLYGVIATFGPIIVAETQFRIAQARGVSYEIAQETDEKKERPGFADILAGHKQQVLPAQDTNFSVVIPKIGASSKIIPNVDSTNSDEFLPALQKGVAHAKGSVFPGMSGNIYLFAHSADSWWQVEQYNAVFYLLLHMKAGDEIVVFFEGERHEYVITQTRISNPEDITLLTQAQGGKEQLVLQTCWPPGTTWKRFYVLAEPKQPN